LEECEDDIHTPEMGLGSLSGVLKQGVKTPHLEMFFISLESYRSVDVDNGLACTNYGKKKVRESNWQFDSRPLKVGNQPDPGVCRCVATQCWKTLKESYKFASDLIPIGGLSKKL